MRVVVESLDNLHDGQDICYISTGNKVLDKYFGGGIPCGNIIQLVGPSGAGKSQFCMQLVAYMRANDDQKMAREFGSTKNDAELLENILLMQRTTFPGLENVLNKTLVEMKDLKLLFLDDLELILPDIYGDEKGEQMLSLHKLAVLLKTIARKFNAAVIVVNGVRYDPTSNTLTSVLGLSWKMYFTYRLWMNVIEKEPRQRQIIQKKWFTPQRPPLMFKIVKTGLVTH
uniref:RecA family profile 1 domain-containing protein n=1 Tax=Panagrolaimus sp. JU765 TaxID=591449 RepID=A0AC34Q628_9BILA